MKRRHIIRAALRRYGWIFLLTLALFSTKLWNRPGVTQTGGRLEEAVDPAVLALAKNKSWDELRQLGEEACQQGRLTKAEVAFLAALEAVKTGKDKDPRHTFSLSRLANVYRLRGKLKRAEELLIEAINLQHRLLPEDHHEKALADVSQLALKLEQGYTGLSARRALHILENDPGRDRLTYALALSHAGRHLGRGGDHLQGNRLIRHALRIQRSALGPAHPDVGGSLRFLGANDIGRGAYAPAREHLTQALAIFEKSFPPDHPDIAAAAHLLARAHMGEGQYQPAEPLLARAMAIHKKVCGPEHPRVAAVLASQGRLLEALGKPQQAAQCYQKSLRINDKTCSRLGVNWGKKARGQTLTRLGVAYADAKQYEPAAKALEQAMQEKRHEVPPVDENLQTIIRRLPRVLEALEDYPKTEAAYEKLLANDRRVHGREHPMTLLTTEDVARFCASRGKKGRAAELSSQARALRAKLLGPENTDRDKQVVFEAMLALAQGRWVEALKRNAELAVQQMRYRSMIAEFCRPEQMKSLIKNETRKRHRVVSIALRTHREYPEAAKLALQCAMASKCAAMDGLVPMHEAHQGRSNPKLRKIAKQISRLRREWVQLENAPADAPGEQARREKLKALESGLEKLENELARESPFLGRLYRMRNAHSHAVAEALPDDGALISYLIVWDLAEDRKLGTENRMVALVVTKGQPPTLHDLGEASQVGEVAGLLYVHLLSAGELIARRGEAQAAAAVLEAGRDAFDVLLRPIWDRIKDKRRWIISPDSGLGLLNFALITDPETDRPLLETREISYVPSSRDVVNFGRHFSGGQGALIIANPDFDAPVAAPKDYPKVDRTYVKQRLAGTRWPPLPGTQLEAQALKQLLEEANIPVIVRSGCDAAKWFMFQPRPPRFLHVASHGFFLHDMRQSMDADPMIRMTQYVDPDTGQRYEKPIHSINTLLFSGLAFAGANGPKGYEDGIAMAFELTRLDLRGTELAVLSACETGRGSATVGAGVRGLRQTFLQAGAVSLVMSLWKVPDRETADLMEAFYRRLLKGERKAEALRKAMLEIRAVRQDRKGASHPFYWGAFVLVGDPGSLRAEAGK